jgi:antitoxin ParD1/3/4
MPGSSHVPREPNKWEDRECSIEVPPPQSQDIIDAGLAKPTPAGPSPLLKAKAQTRIWRAALPGVIVKKGGLALNVDQSFGVGLDSQVEELHVAGVEDNAPRMLHAKDFTTLNRISIALIHVREVAREMTSRVPGTVTEFDTAIDAYKISVMAVRTSMNVSLTPQLAKFIERRVTSGRYHTASEVVREGLRLLELQERDRDEAFKSLKAKLADSAAQAERGELVDPDRVLRKIEQLKKQRRRSA